MNTHRSFGFLAAFLVTVAQILVFSSATSAAANSTERGGYEVTLNG